MKNLLIIQIANDLVKALYTKYELQDEYRISEHDNLERCLSAYEDELKEVSDIVFVSDGFDYVKKDIIKTFSNRYGIKNKIRLLDYREAFANYNIVFAKTFKHNKFTMIQQNYDELVFYIAEISYSNKEVYIDIRDNIIENVGFYDLDNDNRDERLQSIAQNFLEEDIQLLYLTGDAFSGGYMKKSLEVLCSNNRRVFFEENLLILGGYAYIKNRNNSTYNYNIHTKYTSPISAYIDVNTLEGYKKQYIFDFNTRTYDDLESVELITFNDEKLDIFISGKINKKLSICVSHLVRGINKPTRLRLKAHFIDNNKMLAISVQDIGFGMFVKSSMMQVKAYIIISDEEDSNE